MGLTPLQRRIALVALLVSVVAIVWMLTHRRSAISTPQGIVPAAKFLDLTAKTPEGSRPLVDGEEIKQSEALDFHLQVFDIAFVYIVKVLNGTPSLAWGHKVSDPVWDPGVYAPDWNDGRPGLPLSGTGDLEVYAIVSPQPLVDVSSWDLSTVKNPHGPCPRCAVSSIHFKVK